MRFEQNLLARSARRGLSAYQLKLLALFFMTIDHIGAYAFTLPVVSAYVPLLRLLGRIAAPLFLYLLTQSVRYTRSKLRLLLRLYAAAVLTGLITTVMNLCFADTLGICAQSNIFFSYFYTVLYILLIESLLHALRGKQWLRAVGAVAALASSYLPHLLCTFFYGLPDISLFGRDLFDSFLQSPLLVEYSPLFLLLGVLLYFSKTKRRQVAVFFVFCCISFIAGFSTHLVSGMFSEFLGYPQYWMVLAVPFMLLYNGERGAHPKKYLFYLYYPLHRYLIVLVSYLLLRRS